jgi:hypothetical protein
VRQLSSIANYRGGFGINESVAGSLDNMGFADESLDEFRGGDPLRLTDGIPLSIEEKFRFVHYLIKLIEFKMRKERKHFTNMRRFALNNNQKDDYLNIIRQQCELIEMTFYSILEENLYDDLAVVDGIVKGVYEHEEF